MDSSSLVKLYIDEEGSSGVREMIAGASLVATSVLAYPEARSALARLRREGRLSEIELAQAKSDLERDWGGFLALPVDAVWRQAGDLAERHGLRGADSVHLAAYLSLLGLPHEAPVRFSSFDERLNLTARREAGEG
ncbi:MAG TPA: type II toxin-antitoxin system VapC family toxin [Thermoanaerobaculia bacterium]|nr:type II toxin-antitoxin system VapC family toxin [Thermoanaerobaculia bacterium]